MKPCLFACFIAITSMMTGCSQKAPPLACKTFDDLTALKMLQPANAVNDAHQKYLQGDHRLFGINAGVGLVVPGLTGNPDNSGYELQMIDIGDVSCNSQEHQIKRDAWNYVQKYNSQMILLWHPGKRTSATDTPIPRKHD